MPNPFENENQYVDAQGAILDNVTSVMAESIADFRYATRYSGASGGDKIQNAMDDSDGSPSVVVVSPNGPDDVSGSSGSVGTAEYSQNAWELTSTLKVPANTALVLNNCYLFATDGLDTNPIQNSDINNGDENISVVGVGRPIIDGNASNQNRSGGDGSPKWVMMDFVKCDNLTIHGLDLRNSAGWTIKPEGGSNLVVNDIYFDMDASVNNQDGVHVGGPADVVNISNLRGTTKDDMVAIEIMNKSSFFRTDGGDSRYMSISDINGDDNNKIALFGGDGDYLRWVSVSNSQAVVELDGTFAATPATRREMVGISINGLSPGGLSFFPTVRIDGNCEKVAISNVHSTSDNDLLEVSNGTAHGVSITNCTCSGFGNSAFDAIEVQNGVTVNGLQIKNLYTDGWAGGDGDGPDNVIKVAGTVNGLDARGIYVAKATNVIDFSGTVGGYVDGVTVSDSGATDYVNLGGVDFGQNVPALSSGSLTMDTANGVGVKTTTVAGVTSQEGRRPSVDFIGVDTGTTPDADYEWREEPAQYLWDDSDGEVDVVVRANLITDPGSDFDVGYEIKPGSA